MAPGYTHATHATRILLLLLLLLTEWATVGPVRRAGALAVPLGGAWERWNGGVLCRWCDDVSRASVGL